VDQFLSRHPQFARDTDPTAVPAALLTAHGDLQSLPFRHGLDGAYAARLRRARKIA